MRMRLAPTACFLAVMLGGCAAVPAARPSDATEGSVPTRAPAYAAAASTGPLFDTVAALDSAFFDGFNRCADPMQLQRHAAQLDAALEFYHDNGGASFSSAKYLADVKSNVCGKFERKRVPGTLRVYPIPGFGAIALGVHVFCPFESGRCEGAGDFLIVWQQRGDGWADAPDSYGASPG